jgi:hypothetical protein
MAIMIPSVISPEANSSAERRVFDWFLNAPNTDDWIVLHSLGISTHNKVIYGETDFFVLVPDRGVFAFEVKGGRVKRENGIWYFTNKYGKTNSKVRGPFEQAKDGIFSIISSLRGRLDNSHNYLSDVFFGFGVIFPDIEYEVSGVDEEQWQVFDSRDGKNIRDFVLSVASKTRQKWENLYGHLNGSKLPSFGDIQYLASILRGDFDCVISMSAQLRNAEEALISLTKEQYRCLDQLDDNPRCLIQGPAGTGKTLLAVEDVKKTAALGKKVAIFCFNSNLAEWLSGYFSDMPEILRPAYVGTLHRYMKQVIKDTSYELNLPRNEDELQEYYQKELPSVTLKALSTEQGKFDKIVIDEAQDLIRVEYLDVFDACLRKGIVRGCWTMFGDFSMQAIYSNEKTSAEMLGLLENRTSFIRFKLTLNCRNTKQICEEVQTVTGFEAPAELWSKIEGPPVNYITFSSPEDQRNKLAHLLAQLSEMYIPADKITILSPRKRENSCVALLSGFDIRGFTVRENTSLTFCTIQAYKGLENSIIILTDIDNFDSEKLMYVGLSRARMGLYILESELASKEYLTLLKRRLSH